MVIKWKNYGKIGSFERIMGDICPDMAGDGALVLTWERSGNDGDIMG